MSSDLMDSLFASFLISDAEKIGIIPFLLASLQAFASGSVLSWFYYRTNRWNPEVKEYSLSLALFCVMFCIVTMIIGANIARAFGLVGALSIIRFRNTVKSIQDILFVFWTLALGMTIGSGYFVLSLVFLILTILMYRLYQIFLPSKDHLHLPLSIEIDQGAYESAKGAIEAFLRASKVPFNSQSQYFDEKSKKIVCQYFLRVPTSQLKINFNEQLEKIDGVAIKNYFFNNPI